MSEFITNDKLNPAFIIKKKIALVLLALLCLITPVFQPGLTSLLIGLIFITSLFFIHKMKKIRWLQVVLTGFGLFCLYAMSLLYSSDFSFGVKIVETKLPLLILPLSLALIGPFSMKEFQFLISAFLVGLIISEGYHLLVAAVEASYTQDYTSFHYSNLSGIFHTSYLSMYFVVGIAVLLFMPKIDYLKKADNPLTRWVLIGLFILFILLLSSKTALLTTVVVLFSSVAKHILSKSFKQILYPLSLIALFFTIFFCAPNTQGRVQALAKSADNSSFVDRDPTYRNSTDARKVAWEASFQMLMDNPFGVGAGDYENEIVSIYELNSENFMVEKRLNSHNQYLQTAASIGWLGFVLLALMFLLLFGKAINQKDWLLGVVSLVICLNLVTESMLERASGTVFLMLIISLLVNREFSSLKGE